MPHYNRENIDRKTNKPTPERTEGVLNDQIFNRAEQVRRDDDVIKTPKRTIYDIDYGDRSVTDSKGNITNAGTDSDTTVGY